MDQISTNLKLPYLLPSQAQKHIIHNEALRMLDGQIHIGVATAQLSAPPASPEDGERFIVGDSATGAWAGREQSVAAWQDGAWAFFAPNQGWLAHVSGSGELLAYDGSGWQPPVSKTDNLKGIGINTTSDSYNKVSVKTDSILVSHDDVTPGSGDTRLTLNKSASGNVAALQMQTGYSGKVELGLIGNNAFAIRYNLPVHGWKSLLHFDETHGGARFFGDMVIDTQGQQNTPATVQTVTTDGRARLQFYNNSNNEYWELAAELETGKALKLIGSDGASSTVPLTIAQGAGNDSLHVDASGNIGIGKSPSGVKLDVDGAVKPASYTVATLPDAASSGPGSMIYVSDETGGGVPAFSDGTDWRRVTDRAVVS